VRLQPTWEKLSEGKRHAWRRRDGTNPRARAHPTELLGDINVAKVNTAENSALSRRFNIRGLPTLKLFFKGREWDYSGARTAEALAAWARKVRDGDVAGGVAVAPVLGTLEEIVIGFVSLPPLHQGIASLCIGIVILLGVFLFCYESEPPAPDEEAEAEEQLAGAAAASSQPVGLPESKKSK
jgi:hypothetical protein